MPLSPLTLNATSGVIGKPFSATVSGLSAGSTLEVANDGTPGFSTVNGRVLHSGLPFALNTLVLRETLAGEGVRESRIQILGDQADTSDVLRDRWAASRGARLSGSAVLTNPRGLRRFRAKLGNALYAPVHIGCHGDSITQGVGTENPSSVTTNTIADARGWPGQLRALFAARYGTLGGGAITPFYSGTDSRVARDAGVTADLTIGPCLWGGRIRSDRPVTFTTPACTAVDILYFGGDTADGTLNGGFTYQVDGGTVTQGLASGNNTGATKGYKVLSITGLANTTHTITLAGISATNSQHITAIRYHNNQGVTVSRWGRAGWTIADYLGVGESSRNNAATSNAYSRSRLAAQFGAWNEALTIISLGQNDGTFQQTLMGGGTGGEAIGNVYTTPDYYEARLREIVANVAALGGCTLLLNTNLPPSGGVTVPSGGQPYYAYHQAARRIASDTDHVAHLSIADRWGMTGDTSSAENVTLGMLSDSASVHPSLQGYGDYANAIFEALMRPDLTV